MQRCNAKWLIKPPAQCGSKLGSSKLGRISSFIQIQRISSTFRNCEEVNIKVSMGQKWQKHCHHSDDFWVLAWISAAPVRIQPDFTANSTSWPIPMKLTSIPNTPTVLWWLFLSFSWKKHNLRNWHAGGATLRFPRHTQVFHIFHIFRHCRD